MSIGHLLYVPLIGLVGLAFGYAWGAKAMRRQIDEAERRARKS